MREIEIFVGEGLDAEEIIYALNACDADGIENTSLFELAHAVLSDQLDDRAEIHSVSADEITFNKNHPNQITLKFTTSWSAYYGCRDMCKGGDEEETEKGIYSSEGYLIFMVPDKRRQASQC
jgi:hypothetical protein